MFIGYFYCNYGPASWGHQIPHGVPLVLKTDDRVQFVLCKYYIYLISHNAQAYKHISHSPYSKWACEPSNARAEFHFKSGPVSKYS